MPMLGMQRRILWTQCVTFALAILVVGTAYLYQLGGAPLWGDEAGTGLFARNVLQFGYPTGFDGRNLSIYDAGAELNADLAVAKIPWIQFYLGALSLHIFGNDAQGLRTLFALVGLAALLPMWSALRSRVPLPLFVATLILLTPQVVLFHRNARYYSVLTLVFAVLVWMVCDDGLSKARRLCVACACMVVLFHAHPVAAVACGSALVLQAAWLQRSLFIYLVACVAGIASWLLWTAVVGPTLVAPQLFMDFRGGTLVEWFGALVRNLGAAIGDLDAVQGMPLLAWVLGLGVFLKLRPHRFAAFVKDPLVSFVMLTLVLHTIAVAMLFGTETSEEHSLLRYMPHLIAFAMAPLFMLIANLVKDARGFAVLCVTLVASNLLSVSFWNSHADKKIPISWWPATYNEIVHPQPESIDAVMAVIRREASANQNDMDALLAIPSWLQEVAIFYLGDELIVLPNIERGSAAEGAVRAKIGQEAMARFGVRPKWVLHEAQQAPTAVRGYERIQIQTHRMRPDDGTRPELTRHTFYQQQVVGYISLYKRLD